MAPIPAERCIAGRDLTEPRLRSDGTVLGYAVSQQGVAALAVQRLDVDEPVRWLAQEPPLRAGRGLGGGAWCFSADERRVVYAAVDGQLWSQSLDGSPAVVLTSLDPATAISGPMATPDGSGVVFVVDVAEVHLLDLASGTTRRLDDGSDAFCMDPWVDRDGCVRWHAWDVPDMPWDRSRVRVAGPEGAIVALETARGVQQPRSLRDGTPVAVRDDTGWLNVWVGDAPMVDEAYEHAGPSWGPGQRSYAWSPDGASVAFTRNEHGFGRLCVADRRTGRVREVARGVHGQLSWADGRLAALRTGARTPTQVVVYDTSTWQRTVVALGPSGEWQSDQLVEPERVEVSAAGGGSVHARLYRADDADGRLIVWLHGGPTDQWQVTFIPRIEYWRSRGWNVLVPDHRGSTGHGREYQQALRGRWGELDVTDTLTITRHAHDRGWGQRSRTIAMGSSSGGFTVLGAIAAEPGRFAGAVVLYPVTDLLDLAERSHRFEQHYTDSLVGPLPEAEARYRERSPIMFADRCTLTPVLVLHGDADAVVPVEQSLVFAQRVRAAGGDVELHVYPGEGHGFRQAANQLDEYRRVGDFLARCVPIASPS